MTVEAPVIIPVQVTTVAMSVAGVSGSLLRIDLVTFALRLFSLSITRPSGARIGNCESLDSSSARIVQVRPKLRLENYMIPFLISVGGIFMKKC